MLSSKKLKSLQKYIDIIEANKGKTIGNIYKNIVGKNHAHFKKGASGLIIENLLGLENNASPKADLKELKVEIKVLPLQLHNLKVKEPTQIKMINFMEVARETWETAKIRDKIETIFWIVYGVPRDEETKKNLGQENYVIIDWLLMYLMVKNKLFSRRIGSGFNHILFVEMVINYHARWEHI